VADEADLPGGPAATGRAGDLLLSNEHVVAVIGAPRPGAPPGRAGAVLDLAPRGGADVLGEVVPVFDEAGRRMARFERVVVERDGATGGPAVVRATGVDALDEQIAVECEYVLEPGARALRLRTTLTQRGRSHYRDFVIGRLVEWGGLDPFVPGAAGSLAGQRVRSDWIGADSPGTSLAFAPVGGRMESIHARSWSLVIERREWLQPGTVLTREALLYVDGGGGVATAAAALQRQRGTVVGAVDGTVADWTPVADARVTWFDADGTPALRARTDAAGRFAATLPAGTYRTVAEAPGRAPGAPVWVRVHADGAEHQALRLERPSGLHAIVRDEAGRPLPARLDLEPAAGGSATTLLAPTGEGTWPLAPGTWRVEVGAGPDRARAERVVRVPAAAEATVDVALAREIDRAGFTAVDPYVRTRLSGTSAVPAAVRVAACAVEGLDAIVVADDDAVDPGLPSPPTPQVWAGVAVGANGGRFAAFPVAKVADAGAPGPVALLSSLRALAGPPLVAVLRPREAGAGYFETYAFDGRAPALPRGGFSLDFDLLQVGVPWPRDEADKALADYFALLDRGRDVVPFGASGADALADPPCGLPRTLVHGSGLDALRSGDVVVSYGPLIDLTVDGVRPGGRAPPRDAYDVRIRVRSSGWRRPAWLDLIVDGETWRRVPVPPGSGPLTLDHRLLLPGGQVRWVLARVDGPPDADGIPPLAFTAAVRLGDAIPPGNLPH
jgi:hypothetical protein